MIFRLAEKKDFEALYLFYNAVIDQQKFDEYMPAWTKDVYPLGPYRLLLKLSTGEQYTLDCSELLQIPLFARIRDPAFFSTVHTDETGLICWDNATDIEPGWLSANLEPADAYPDIQALRELEKRLESDLEDFHDDSACQT